MRRGLVSEVFVTESAQQRFGSMLSGAPIHVVTERAAKALSDTVTPVGLVAVCQVPETTLQDVVAATPRLVWLTEPPPLVQGWSPLVAATSLASWAWIAPQRWCPRTTTCASSGDKDR